jgi:hypothetical protein
MLFKVRLLVMGLLAVMALGMVASTAASARPGPFWWHRNAAKEGEGVKLAENAIEQGKGESKETTFSTKVGGTPLTLAGQIKVKVDIWNVPQQGQIKIQVQFDEVHPTELPNCNVTVTVPHDYYGHLMWKYRGNKKELEQGPVGGQETVQGQEWDIAILPQQTVLGNHGFEGKNVFAELKFASTNCGVFNSVKLTPEGVSGIQDQQLKLGEFAKKLTVSFPGHEIWQHYWPGTLEETEGVEAKGELTTGATASFFNGRLPLEWENQEIDVREQ